ncbi:hypothetical protein [Pseudopedobacter beijingensis]|uniref:Immunity protein Imm1 n=1 Tax=Pseudopedobacter beijingensis TaxID=1207056 RepID=A0ABW4IDB9_9SPHI
MNQVYRTLLLRYQNYLLEFFQLIEDKSLIEEDSAEEANEIRAFLENLPDMGSEFEISFSISKQTGGLVTAWDADISDEGFSVRSFSTDDNLEEVNEWYLHYHDSTQEYEGNLFTDGDWDLFLEEIADLDEYEGGKLSASLSYKC